MRRLLAALALTLATAAALPVYVAHAHGPATTRHHRPPVAAPNVLVIVEATHGDSFASAVHRGTHFVAGELGERYNVRLVNSSAERLEVVVSVDGRDVLSGKLGDFARQRGYVLPPFGELVVDGFRRSTQEVAAFRFSAVRDSYSARRGTPQHVGVIGVAVFRERAAVGWGRGATAAPSRDEARRSAPAKPKSADAAPRSRAEERLGTEFGETVHSPIVEVGFVRRNASRPDELHRVVYDSAERLRARGVPIEPVFAVEPWSPSEPSPWPAARDDDRFAPPPPPRRTWR